jgi:TPR repeat protein
MKSGRFFSSLMLAGLCLWTLNTTAAESQSIELRVGARDGEADQRELSALNTLGIRYAKGQGVKRNPGMAMRFFLRSAMRGYTPAMANMGTLYEIGALGNPNMYRAYAWVRAALSFGVPVEDHDATVLRLGMIAARLGSANIDAAERLAGVISSQIVETCQCSPAQETELASNRSL